MLFTLLVLKLVQVKAGWGWGTVETGCKLIFGWEDGAVESQESHSYSRRLPALF